MIDLTTDFQMSNPEPNVYHLRFSNQRDLTHTMMRLQEYYESPDPGIKGQHFTLEQFLHHYTNVDGYFDYTSKWAGFNVPGNIVDEWRVLFSTAGSLTAKESQMMSALDAMRKVGQPWYLIATSGKNDTGTLRHELAHARYYLHNDYSTRCDDLIDRMFAKDRRYMRKVLLRMGYAETVINDEIQAYLSTGTKAMNLEMFGVLSDKSQASIKELRTLFRTWAP
jgi:hypothetical protein